MIERLDTITRQLGLKLTKDQKRSADRKAVDLFEVFISSDMFYVEVVVESNGRVCDVKVIELGMPPDCSRAKFLFTHIPNCGSILITDPLSRLHR